MLRVLCRRFANPILTNLIHTPTMNTQPASSRTPTEPQDPSETSTLADLPRPSKPIQPSTHVPRSPDLSYPFQTTDLPEDVGDDEYREVARSGVVAPGDAILNAAARLPSIDAEKARRMKEVNLVVFKPDDPEDPRTWSRWYRWCKHSWIVCLTPSNLAQI